MNDLNLKKEFDLFSIFLEKLTPSQRDIIWMLVFEFSLNNSKDILNNSKNEKK